MRRGVSNFVCVTLLACSLAACAPGLKQAYTKIETVPGDKALIYIYRTLGPGSLIYYDVKANGNVVTTLYSETYYPYIAAPGEIEFSAKTEASDSVTMDVKAGQTYFLKGTVGVGFLVGHPHLTVVSQEEAEKEIVDCKLLLNPN